MNLIIADPDSRRDAPNNIKVFLEAQGFPVQAEATHEFDRVVKSGGPEDLVVINFSQVPAYREQILRGVEALKAQGAQVGVLTVKSHGEKAPPDVDFDFEWYQDAALPKLTNLLAERLGVEFTKISEDPRHYRFY